MNENELEINDLISKNSVYQFNNIPVPRVTTVIDSMIHEDNLIYWANSLGLKGLKYSTVRREALDIGTKTHSCIEKILKQPEKYVNLYRYHELNTVKSFLNWYEIVTNNNVFEVIYTEEKLICNLFGGTLDALVKINGKLYLIDFKTSKIITYKYLLQLAAYRKMLKDIKNIDIDGIIILQLGKENIKFNEYVINLPEYLDMVNYFEMTFINLVNAYVNILTCQQYFKLYKDNRVK